MVRSAWRDRDPAEAAADAPFTVRLKAPHEGETVVDDLVKGGVTFQNKELDDLVLLRSDGSPTYNLAVVVDDHDMGITHVIRGDDHLNNAARQTLIYKALGWDVPAFAHVPLIHGPDGAKLSKRHGAQAVGEFRDMGYLPEAMRNYLARLGWGHGDDEMFSDEQAAEWFDVADVVKAPARLDWDKLNFINQHYIRAGRRRPAGRAGGRGRTPRVAACTSPRAATLGRRDRAGEGRRADHPAACRPDAVRAEVAARSRWTTRRRSSSPRRRAPASRRLRDALGGARSDWTPPTLEPEIRSFAESGGRGARQDRARRCGACCPAARRRPTSPPPFPRSGGTRRSAGSTTRFRSAA